MCIGTLNMLELCRRNGIRKFILASTSSIYGANPPYPTPEIRCRATSRSSRMPPARKAPRRWRTAYHHLYGIDVSILRYFTVYGPAGRPDLALFRFVQWISEGRPVRVNGDGKQSRGFTYVDDIARGTIAALKPLGYEIINLGGHEVITINDLVTLIEELSAKRRMWSMTRPTRRTCSPTGRMCPRPANCWTGQPQVNMREGVRRLVEWYNAERSWASEVLTP